MVKVKNKKLKKLLYEKNWLDKKVAELTKDRKKDRSWDAKATLVRLKKQKALGGPLRFKSLFSPSATSKINLSL